MAAVTRFEDVEAWQTARALTNLIYGYSARGDFQRDFGLKDQICRASVSVMSNIAEGFESQTQATFIRFLGIAKASAGEVRSQIYIALDQGFISELEFNEARDLADKVSRQLYNFIAYLQRQPNARRVSDRGISYIIG